MRRGTKAASSIVLALVLTMVIATIATATVSKTGTKNCGQNYTGYTQSYSTGTTEHLPPGSGYHVFYNGSVWLTRKWYSNNPGDSGFWGVYVTGGSLSDPNTFAGCELTGS